VASLGVEVVDAADLVARGGSAALPEIQPDWLAYVLFTSGSTGRPKGVEVTHANLAAYVGAMLAEPGYRREDVFLAVSPLWFDLSCFDLWVPLSIGARVAITDRATATDGFALAAWLAETGVTAMDVPPTLLRLLLASGWQGGAIRLISGGEALDAPLAQELLERVPELWNAYGPTETTVTVTVHSVRSLPADPLRRSLRAGDGAIPIGHPVAGTRLYVCNRAGRLVAPGVTGELWIGGAGVARGYRGRPDLTARAFVADPVLPAARCYRSGDLARWRPDGSLEFIGRNDDQVKVRGYRIEPGEVEAALRDHPAVAHAAVAVNTSGLVGYVVPRTGAAADLDALAAHLRRRVPAYMVPSQWAVLDRLPTTSSGKVDRRALPEPWPGVREVVAPRGPMEELVAEVWAEVLGRDDIGATGDFLASGGHSLAAVRVVAALRERIGAEIPARALFLWPVLADFAAEVERVTLAQLTEEIEVNG
jgi:amino acid adenylation domain-containing protein